MMLAIYSSWLVGAVAMTALGITLALYLWRRLGPLTPEQERALRFREEARRRLNRIIG
jgi:hypothetical protein